MSHAAQRALHLQALGERAASVAHGLNGLLSAIAAQSALLLDADRGAADDAERRRGLQLIFQAALDGARLTRSLLRQSQGEPPDDVVAPELVDLAQVMHDAVALTRRHWEDMARASGVHIDVRVEVEPPLLVHGSPADLREVMVNLIVNAIDALPAGGALRLRGQVEDGVIVVTCQDSGSGIEPEVLGRIFEPFFTRKGRRGNGLGLAIVQRVVAQHGGEVHVASTVGVGTTVTLRLPAAELAGDEARAGRAPLAEAGTGVGAALAASLATSSVLVVDDDPGFRAAFARRLSLDAREVGTVGDAASALAALETGRWDLVCIDDGLPDQTGRALAAELARRQHGCAVILLTGAATRLDDPALAGPGIDAVLPKPCTDVELARALRLASARAAPRRVRRG